MHQNAHISDPRHTTYANRVRIGFLPDARLWQDAPATFSDHQLTINGHPVMEDWEEHYMQELAAIACSQGGRVLEVGFGLGLSARAIQQHAIAEHLIIEANREVYTRLLAFAHDAPCPVTPLLGFWQDVTREMQEGSLSGILFDTYPLAEHEIHRNHFDFFPEAYRLLMPGGVLTYYSDEMTEFSPEHLRRLQAAGFQHISSTLCPVSPPKDCQYWQSPTILAPIVIK